jgi:Lon-like ATP-dependent protease
VRSDGVSLIVLPEGNRKDWNELTEEMTDGLEVHFVASYDQVFSIAFPHLDAPCASM